MDHINSCMFIDGNEEYHFSLLKMFLITKYSFKLLLINIKNSNFGSKKDDQRPETTNIYLEQVRSNTYF